MTRFVNYTVSRNVNVDAYAIKTSRANIVQTYLTVRGKNFWARDPFGSSHSSLYFSHSGQEEPEHPWAQWCDHRTICK